MSSAFTDTASESRIQQALAECAALTRANDPRRALNAGRMIETAHLGQPRVLARVARMYSDLGMQDESARVLRGLHSAVRPSVAPISDQFASGGELPSYGGGDDEEPPRAKSLEEYAGALPGLPGRASGVSPPLSRVGAQASSVPPPPPRGINAPSSSSVPPPPRRGIARLSSSVPPPPQRNGGPPRAASAPPPPFRSGGGAPAASAPPPPPRTSGMPFSTSAPPPPLRATRMSSSAPPPPPPGAWKRSSVPPPGQPMAPLASAPAPLASAPAPSLKANPVGPSPAPQLHAAFSASGEPLRLPPPPGFDEPNIQVTAGEGEWDFDDDDDEPTRAFNPGLVPPRAIASRPAPPAALPQAQSPRAHASFSPAAEGSGWRDRMQQLRTKTVESFEQLKKKSGDQLRKISSRPPPPDMAAPPAPIPRAPASVQPVSVQAEAPDFRERALSRYKPKKGRVALLAALAVGTVVLVFWHRHTRQRQEALENDLTQAKPLLWSSDVSDVKKISNHLEQSFEVTSYGELANGFAGALGLSDEPLFVSLESEAQVLSLRQHTVLRLLDPNTDPKLLKEQLAALNEADVPQERVRFVKLLPALAGKSGEAAEAEQLDDSLKDDPVALLLSGILLERVGRVEEAAKRYSAATKVEPAWHLPKVYQTRLALLTQGADEAKPELEAMREAARVDPNLGIISRALNALAWVVDSGRSRELPDTAKLEAAEVANLPPVLAAVPELLRLVQAMLDEKDELKELLTKAIENADGPALLVQLAGFAAAVNQGDLVDDAIERVQEFSRGYAPAKALAARMQLRKGDFAAARQTAKAADLDTSSIDAVEAYELQDAKNLRNALKALPDSDKQKPEYQALLAANGILTGAEYPSTGKLEDFVESTSLWGELIAVDAALDQGDLGLAREIIKEWAENERTALHEIRIARYERYKGRSRDAVMLSKKALDNTGTSNRALIEHINALLADERLADAVKLYGDALYKDLLKPHDRWMDALLVGKDKGWTAANVITSYLQPPGADEALALRLLALRAMSVAGDPRAGVYLKRMAKEVPQNPDYLTAQSEY